jgi:hypothetical protein
MVKKVHARVKVSGKAGDACVPDTDGGVMASA